MQRRSTILSVEVVLILGMVGCATGPQTTKDYNGDYRGSTTGAPPTIIEFTVSGTAFSGTGNINTSNTILWSNSDDPPDLVITGTRTGAQITLMSATIKFKRNITANDTIATWIDYTGELRFTGDFNKTGGVTGSFGGEASGGGVEIPLGGSWIAVKQSVASGIIKP